MNKYSIPENAVAIVGIACRFPGARNLDEFWQNLRDGKESITFFKVEELDPSIPDELKSKPNYVRAKGKLDDVDKFDAKFFGVSPVEAKLMDPQQRLLLELAWSSLEDAGIVPGEDDNLIGVWVGTNWNRYYAKNVRGSVTEKRFGEFNTQLANEFDFPASRIAYKLNLTGPAITMATACSTSLVALGQAMQSLLNYECNAALAGGVSVTVPLNAGYEHHEGEMLSEDGHCRPFDANSSGTTFNDGAAVVTLKRLEDAIEDGDEIYAVVRGVGVNNDGSDKVSYTAPSVNGQIDVLRAALANADVDPATISLVETHGTGTHLGDPIEVAAIRSVYGEGEQSAPCVIGALKSNIGHVIHAAGIAGVIKAALSVRDGVIPPTVNFETPNPGLQLEGTRFSINRELMEWPGNGVRRAGVSSFGVGGTNAHAIVEQPPIPQVAAESKDAPEVPPLLFVSAKDAETCARQASQLADYAKNNADTAAMADIGYTLTKGRARFDSRAAIFADDLASLAATTEQSTSIIRGKARPLDQLVWAFPGQGAQRMGMGIELAARSAVYRDALAEATTLLNTHLDLDLNELLNEKVASDKRISETKYAQPALFAVGYALARHYESVGIRPDLLVGHSIGEFAAACIAGVFSLKDAARVVCERGRLMQAQPRGSMLSVSATADELSRFVNEDVCIAVRNAADLCVLAGPDSALEAIAEELRNDDVRVSMLQTSHAFHSKMMDGALEEFGRVIDSVERQAPRIPIVSTCTGEILTDLEAQSTDYWVNQIRLPVRFSSAVETLLSLGEQEGIALLELGPGKTIASLFSRQSGPEHFSTPTLGLNENDAYEASWLGLGALWCAGYELPLNEWWDEARCRKIRIPSYPFRRDSHWLDPVPVVPGVDVTDLEDTGSAPEEQDAKSQVFSVFTEVTGLELIDADAAKPLSELGLDSLLLTQIAAALQQTFGVVITIKDLIQDLNTIEKVAGHVEKNAPKREATQDAAQSAARPSTSASGQAGTAIHTHLQRRAPKRKRKGVHRRDTRPASFSSWSELGEKRTRALKEFIDAHASKTAGSKKHIAEYRHAHADPRTASGFNPLWKEMVYPLVCTKSRGSEIWDIDGNRYIDMLSGFGPNLLGHAQPDINDAIKAQLDDGIEIGPQSPVAGETAKLVCELTGMDRASFMCTGSEAVQAAIRCARTFTRRTKIVTFEGAYHGNFDEVLTRSSNLPGLLRTSPGSPGIPQSSVAEVVVLPWNDEGSLKVIEEIGDQIAAVLVEPVQSRKPDIRPEAFLKSIRDITRRHGSMLIFDEVVTGFRCHPGGAQAWFGVEADLATYGKVAGGNMPIGIVAGREDVMNTFDGGTWEYGDDSGPDAGVTFFAGTFVRHPLAIAACRTMLQKLKAAGPELQVELSERTERFAKRVNKIFRQYEAPFELAHFTSVMYFRNNDISGLSSLFWYALRHHGVFALESFPSYMTLAHTEENLDEVVAAIEKSLEWMVESELLVEPRKLNLDVFSGPGIPLEAPKAEARLGEDSSGMPGWFLAQDGSYLNVVSGGTTSDDPFATNLAAIIPASESQQEIWSATQLGDDASCAFNDSVTVALRGDVDIAALQSAIDGVAERHESMRSVFSPDGLLLKVSSRSRIKLATSEKPLDDVVSDDVSTPFDLIRGPLFRFTLVKSGDNEPALVLTSHHIVCDGWSCQLILRELSHLYRNQCGEQLADLPPASRLADYNRDAADLLHTESEDYWLDEYSTIPPVLDFPTERSRPGVRTFESRLVDIQIDSGQVEKIKALASKHNASLFNALLAGWYAYTARITGGNDLVVGIPTAGQISSGMPNLVGHCVNLLPLRTNVDVTGSFASLISSAQEKLSDALSYQDYTFGRLLKRLPLPRDASRLPIVSVQFNLDPPTDPSDFDFGGVGTGVTTNPRSYENFELFINIAEEADGLRVLVQYNCNLFEDDVISNRMAEYFALLDAACENSERAVADLDLLTDLDKKRLDEQSINPDEVDHDQHFLRLFDKFAAETPNATAVIGSEASLSYKELDLASSKRASQLCSILPDTADVLIGVALPRNADLLVNLLAIWKVGAAYVPLDPEFPEERLRYMIADAGLAAVLTASNVSLPGEIDVPLVMIDELDDTAGIENTKNQQSVDTRAYVIYTSGSTGQPKGVEIGHRAFSNFLQSMSGEPGLDASSRLVAVTTLSFDIAGLELFGPIMNGGTTIIADHEQTRDGRALVSLLERAEATVMQATPVTWRMLLDADWSCPNGFTVLCGGEAFPGDLATDLVKPTSRVYNLYGPTEATVWSTLFKVESQDWQDKPEATVPIGKPIHGTSVHVLDAQLNDLPPGIPGELFIGGVGLATCYLNRQELTEQRFIDHPQHGRLYRTGDVVILGQDGELRFRERADSQVKVRGFRIELGEIESALAKHPAVAEAVANVYEPAPGDTRLAAYYVVRGGSVDEADLRDLLQNHLPQYMIPQHLVELQSLPLTPNRKVDRKALPAPVVKRSVVIAPRSDTEKLVASVWQELLQAEEISMSDDFFNLGGHSILATRMVKVVEDRTGVRVPLRLLFTNSTLSEFASHVAAAGLIKASTDDDTEEREVLEF